MPYKDPEKQKVAMRNYIREYRAKAKGFATYEEYLKAKSRSFYVKNRLGFLELEVQRLNHCLEVALKRG